MKQSFICLKQSDHFKDSGFLNLNSGVLRKTIMKIMLPLERIDGFHLNSMFMILKMLKNLNPIRKLFRQRQRKQFLKKIDGLKSTFHIRHCIDSLKFTRFIKVKALLLTIDDLISICCVLFSLSHNLPGV